MNEDPIALFERCYEDSIDGAPDSKYKRLIFGSDSIPECVVRLFAARVLERARHPRRGAEGEGGGGMTDYAPHLVALRRNVDALSQALRDRSYANADHECAEAMKRLARIHGWIAARQNHERLYAEFLAGKLGRTEDADAPNP